MNPNLVRSDIAQRKQALRQQILRKRRAQTSQQQQLSSEKICLQLIKKSTLSKPAAIAGYVACGGEVNIQPALEILHHQGWQIALPVIGPGKAGHMQFHEWSPGTPLQKNRFNIPEPVSKTVIDDQVKILLVPLVAFDKNGNRLGMGGGYYDRWLEKHRSSQLKSIGIAYRFQQLPDLPIEAWDQPLQLVITD